MAVESSASRPSVSITSLIQYTLFAAIAYILAGAPYLDELSTIIDSSHTFFDLSSSKSPPKSGHHYGRDGSPGGHNGRGLQQLDNLMIQDPALNCEEVERENGYRGYKTYVLRRDPLVVYVEGFLGEREREEVLGVSDPLYTPSTIFTNHLETLDPSIRLSEKAPLPPSNPLISCIAERARAFQGWHPYLFIEKLWAQRYGVGGHYTYHFDYSEKRGGGGRGKRKGGFGGGDGGIAREGRVSTFMVYVSANCTGGGTHFPRLDPPPSIHGLNSPWCRFIDCSPKAPSSPLAEGITFLPIPGNAIYWENLREDGTGYPETYHAGLPVESGTKVGLNIWSWVQEGFEVGRGMGESVPTKTMSVSVVAGTGETRLVQVEGNEGDEEREEEGKGLWVQ